MMNNERTTNAKINCLLWWFLKVNYLCLNMLVKGKIVQENGNVILAQTLLAMAK